MAESADKPARETYVAPAVPYDFGAQDPLGNPALSNVVTCLVAMGAEMWATKRRLHAVEALLAEKGVSSAEVSAYVPTKEQEAAWEAERNRFLELAFGPLGDAAFRPMSSDDNGFTRF